MGRNDQLGANSVGAPPTGSPLEARPGASGPVAIRPCERCQTMISGFWTPTRVPRGSPASSTVSIASPASGSARPARRGSRRPIDVEPGGLEVYRAGKTRALSSQINQSMAKAFNRRSRSPLSKSPLASLSSLTRRWELEGSAARPLHFTRSVRPWMLRPSAPCSGSPEKLRQVTILTRSAQSLPWRLRPITAGFTRPSGSRNSAGPQITKLEGPGFK